MNRAPVLAACALASSSGLVASCGDHDTIVVIDVNAPAGLTTAAHLHATLSNSGLGDAKTFPAKGTADASVSFPTGFSLTLPASRSGALDVALDALDETGAVVANGDGSVALDPGGTVTLTITLVPGASLCGNGVVDSGEACDDGDRISSGTCDFRCQLRSPPTGGGGRGGAGGSGGGPGAAGAGGRGGGGGTADGRAGTGGSPSGGGTTGAAGTGGTAGSTGGTGGGLCAVELLTNGGFDSGDTGWTSVTSGRALIYTYADVDPDLAPMPVSPDGFAWLGYDVLSETVILKQPIQIPLGTQSLTVSGSVQIHTDDSQTVPYDLGYAEILVGAFAQEVDQWSNVDFGTDWTTFSQTVDTTGVGGATATFQLRVLMDDGGNTSFFFDSLSVVAHLCPL